MPPDRGMSPSRRHSYRHPHFMEPAVPRQGDPRGAIDDFRLHAIALRREDPLRLAAGILHGDAVARRTIGQRALNHERRPVVGDAGLDHQRRAVLHPQAEDRLDRHAVHPAGRSGVPGPAAAADVRLRAVDVGGDGVGLDLVKLRRLRRERM